MPTYTTKGRHIQFADKDYDKQKLEKNRKETRADDGLGPGSYNAKLAVAGPVFSFGSRFNSSLRFKDHLRPRKVDGPGPGAHKLPSGLRVEPKMEDSHKFHGTFGTSARNFINLPKETPAPNKYRPVHFTEASHSYTIPRPADNENKEIKLTPGPGEYNVFKKMDELKNAQ